jgi:polyferredoxin
LSSPSQTALSRIPVKVISTGTRYHGRRRAVQIAMLSIAILVPVTGLFRIDPLAGALVVMDRQIWFSDFFLFSGLWITLATALVFLYSIAGTVFCGWACPQNTLAEWANHMTHRLLGKRAEVSLDGAPIQVAATKNRVVNWALLAAAFVLASMVTALVPMLYFYPPAVVWSFVSLRPDPRLASSLYWIYTVFTLIILLDISVLRHFWCRFICVYRVWQHNFRTRQTLHVAYDASRSGDCSGCNYCATKCFIELDPRHTETYDSCINCGECIDACNVMHQKRSEPGLLRFEFGARGQPRAAAPKPRNNETSLFSRARWAVPFAVLGTGMFAWGLTNYDPYHIAIDHIEAPAGHAARDYMLQIANKRYRDEQLDVRVHGLPEGAYRLSERTVRIGPAQRVEVELSISPELPHGLYSVRVDVLARDGWVGQFKIQHLSA